MAALPSAMRIKLTVQYRTPSLNVTKRQHWAKQYREKKRAWSALSSALLATASDPLIQTISPQAAKICSTAYGTLVSFLATNRGESSSKPSSSKSALPARKKQT